MLRRRRTATDHQVNRHDRRDAADDSITAGEQAAIGAAIVSLLLAYLPVLHRRISATGAWLVPLLSMLTVLFIIRSWFIR